MTQWQTLSDQAKLETWAAHMDTKDEGSPGPALRRLIASHANLLAVLHIILNDATIFHGQHYGFYNIAVLARNTIDKTASLTGRKRNDAR